MTALFSGEMFPSKSSLVVFIAYMALFVNQGIVVTASSSKDKKYNYNTVTVVLLTECIKLLAAVVIYLKEKSCSELFREIFSNLNVLAYYFIPAALYCVYNNLQFVNLAAYDPTTYYLLLQFRVVITGVLFQILFRKKLSVTQWMSLLLLTVGCVIKEMNHHTGEMTDKQTTATLWTYFNPHLALIMIQVFCSCGAGVYNEFLLKVTGFEVHIMVQNIFMYLNSIVCNLVALGFRGQLLEAFTPSSFSLLIQPIVLTIMINNAAIGIVTSLFLRSLNSILKVFASALELLFTAVLCWLIFGIRIDLLTLISIVIVSVSIYIYAQNPVVNQPKGTLPLTNDPKSAPSPSKQQNPA